MMLLFSPCKRCPCPCSDAVLRSCEEALAGIILHRPRVGSFRLCGTAGRGGGVGVPGPESIYTYTYKCIIYVVYVYVYIFCLYTHREGDGEGGGERDKESPTSLGSPIILSLGSPIILSSKPKPSQTNRPGSLSLNPEHRRGSRSSVRPVGAAASVEGL